MALSISCHYCQESSGFYRDIVDSRAKRAFDVIALFPQGVGFGEQYMKAANVLVDAVQQSDPHTIGVAATPTLILLDTRGRIQKYWVGRLSPPQEDEVFDALGLPHKHEHCTQFSAPRVDVQNVSSEPKATVNPKRRSDKSESIIDIRERPIFQVAHISGAINIPFDELEVRVPHEVPLDAQVALYCGSIAACETAARSQGALTVCELAHTVVRRLGYTSVRVMSNDPNPNGDGSKP
jgi:rhodanese-related sulfurtransferase